MNIDMFLVYFALEKKATISFRLLLWCLELGLQLCEGMVSVKRMGIFKSSKKYSLMHFVPIFVTSI